MIRVGYVEDEEATAKILLEYLGNYAKEHALSVETEAFSRAEDLLYGYTGRFDLLLLDIELGRMSGMEAAQKIRRMDAGCRSSLSLTWPAMR